MLAPSCVVTFQLGVYKGGINDVYLGRAGVRVYLNQHGNSWSEARLLSRVPRTDNLTSGSVVDFLGRGTACLLWSSPLAGDARRPLRYLDLMAGVKPQLLTLVRNNLGAETRVEYASSTKFYHSRAMKCISEALVR